MSWKVHKSESPEVGKSGSWNVGELERWWMGLDFEVEKNDKKLDVLKTSEFVERKYRSEIFQD